MPPQVMSSCGACRAYKLGKERWSYNQLKVEIHDSVQQVRLDPKLAKTVSAHEKPGSAPALPCSSTLPLQPWFPLHRTKHLVALYTCSYDNPSLTSIDHRCSNHSQCSLQVFPHAVSTPIV